MNTREEFEKAYTEYYLLAENDKPSLCKHTHVDLYISHTTQEAYNIFLLGNNAARNQIIDELTSDEALFFNDFDGFQTRLKIKIAGMLRGDV